MNGYLWLAAVLVFCAYVGFRDWKRQKQQAVKEQESEAALSDVERRIGTVTRIRKISKTMPPSQKVGVG